MNVYGWLGKMIRRAIVIKQVWVCGVDGVVPLRCFVSVCKLSMVVNCSSSELSHGLQRLMVAHDVTATYCWCMRFVKCFIVVLMVLCYCDVLFLFAS